MRPLTAAQVQFVQVLLEQRLNGERLNTTQAYRVAHPHCAESTCLRAGPKEAKKSHIQAELQRQLRALSCSREYVVSNQVWAIERAKAKDDLSNFNEANMNLAKLNGYLIEKREVLTKEEPFIHLSDVDLRDRVTQRLRELQESLVVSYKG